MLGYSGCCFHSTGTWWYLPQVSINAHATILSSAARTTLTQTFCNPSNALIEEVSYTYPLYDGVSVVRFECHVGKRRLLSKVKTKEQAQSDYQNAVTNNETAAIMDHSDSENDVFLIRLGNVPAKETITVEITFVGELKHDAQSDGVRYTFPQSIAPRYGVYAYDQGYHNGNGLSAGVEGLSITVDVLMEKGSILRELQSPSHSVKVSLGRMSSTPADIYSFDPSRASASLRLVKGDHALLERDFVLIVKADRLDEPRALLEGHPTVPGQRALMATLVPKFSLPPAQPEIVFVIDRSGSMSDKIFTLQEALRIFLKSLPLGICFNICSFGSSFTFLWPTSRVYDASSLNDALHFVSTISANMGGTEMQSAVVATVTNRLKGKDLEVLLLTDGQIFNQQQLFNFVRTSAADNTARFFSLAIGDAASHSLVEGIARAGNGFSQSVIEYEELNGKVVRMLKGALTPHIFDYTLEVQYDCKNDDFEVVDTDEPMSDSETELATTETPEGSPQTTAQQPISLFDANFRGSDAELGSRQQADDKSLPNILPPRALQAPYKIPSLYPFIRTTVYLLLDPRSSHRTPQSLIFRATSKFGPLELKIPISDSGKGETIHQLASRKAMIELEEHHGWLQDASDASGNPFQQLHSETQQRIVARECQSLGIKYQVTGKYCSFVALESDASSSSEETSKPTETETQTLPVRTRHPAFGSVPSPALPRIKSRAPMLSACYAASSAPAPRPLAMGGRALCGASNARQMVQMQASQSFARTPPPPPPPAPGASLFGAVAQAPMQQNLCMISSPVSSFGAPSPPLSSQPAFGAFGQAQPSAQRPFGTSSGGPFGSSTQPSTGGSLFGRASSGSNPFANLTVPTPPPMPSRKKASRIARQEPDSGDPAQLINSSKVHALVGLQTFEGNWEWTQSLFDILGCNMADIQVRVLHLLQVENLDTDAANLLATMLATAFLLNKNTNSRSVWELVCDKAEFWVSRKLPLVGVTGQVIEAHKNEIMALV